MKFIFAAILLIGGFVYATKAQQTSVGSEKTIYIFLNGSNFAKLVFGEEVTLTQAISRSSLSSSEIRGKITLHRLISGTKDRRIIEVNLKAIQKKKSADLFLESGDVVNVISRKKNSS